MLLHGTAIALGSAAALIRGPSGSGKSDLALRCLALSETAFAGQRVSLVSDDQVIVTTSGEGGNCLLQVSAPATIRDRMEIRGIGIVEIAAIARARLELIVDLVEPDVIERMPEPAWETIEGVGIPRIQLAPFEPSSPLRLILALRSTPK